MASKKYKEWETEFNNFCISLGIKETLPINVFHGKRIEEELKQGKKPDIYWEQRILSENERFGAFRDAESVYRDCAFYKDLLISMDRISNGEFNFIDVSEDWFWEDEEEIFIKLEFTADSKRHHIWIKRTSDFARSEFIELLNIVLGSGEEKRFELTGFPNEWVVVYINSEQKNILQDRGWDFWGIDEPDEAIFWQAQQNSRYDYSDELLFFLEKKEFQEIVDQNPWLLYYRGLTYYKLGDENKAWCDWSIAMNSQDKDILDLIRINSGSQI